MFPILGILPVETYPGIKKIGRIDVKDYRRSSDPQVLQLLLFTFSTNADPSVILPAFEKYFERSALKACRVIRRQPVVIEALFTSASDCHRIVKQSEPHRKITFGKHIRAKAEIPLPMGPSLKSILSMVYRWMIR